MKVKLLSEDEILFYRTLELKINSKKIILPRKSIEHIHSKSTRNFSPYMFLKGSNKLEESNIIELRVRIPEDLLLDLDGDLSKIEKFSNRLLSFLEEKNIILLSPRLILNEERIPTDKEIEYLVYISLGIFRTLQADFLVLPTFVYKRKYPKTLEEYLPFFKKLLENIYSYNNKKTINKRIFGYLPKASIPVLKKILELYIENEIFNFALDFQRATPLGLSSVLESIDRFIVSLEKEMNEISLFHAMNVYKGVGREKFGAKDVLALTHLISSYSYFYTHIGFGGNKERFFLFDSNTYFYFEKSKEEFEKIIKEEKLADNKNKSYIEKALNSLIINIELVKWQEILDESKTVKNYLDEKEGLKDSLRKLYKTIRNAKNQKML